MLVPMSSERAHTFLVANCDAFALGNLADATQLDFWKLRFPCIQQWNGILARDREEKLEIFTVSKGSEQGSLGGRFCFGSAPRFAANRNCRRMKLRADPA